MRSGRRRNLVTLTTVAGIVAATDLASKRLASSFLDDRDHTWTALGDAVRFVLVHNDRSAFGVSLGAHTWHVNVALTVAAIVLMLAVGQELARLDRGAPYALGLIVGAAGGNLASLVFSPGGVVDFVAIDRGGGHETVLNVADIAAYIGLVLTVRAARNVSRAIRVEREIRRNTPASVPSIGPAPDGDLE